MKEDKELQEYRDLLKTPTHFEEGFDWKTVVGAIFIGFLMMPGSMYLQLVIGTGIGPAARWVTIILFAELAKRAYSDLKQQEIFLLYYMAGAALHTPFQGMLWNQYLVQSDAARMLGLTDLIPAWVAPPLGSEALVERSLFHRDWLVPILLLIGRGEACVCHLEAALGWRQAYISQHLMALRKADILQDRRAGRYIFYRLKDASLMDLVTASARLSGLSSESISALINTRVNPSCECPQCSPVLIPANSL